MSNYCNSSYHTPELIAARKRKAAAKLRVEAATINSYTEGYRRQAAKPIYPGQRSICLCKAMEFEARANKIITEAELLEAEADGLV